MLDHELLTGDRILVLRPKDPLSSADFEALAGEVDPFIEATGDLQGILIEAESFPGWANFGSFVTHVRFIRDHHRHVRKIAAVSDSGFLSVAPAIGNHFVQAEVRHFPAGGEAEAMEWLREDS